MVYHWSMAMGLEADVARLAPQYEHQLVFFESHFADMK